MKQKRRRYKRSNRAFWVLLIIAALVLVRVFSAGRQPAGPERLEEGAHAVRDVVDGDSLLLESGARVRLQGIDLPPSVREEQRQFIADFVKQAGGRVRLTFGPERIDRHDRFLAFVWDGDRFLNGELVRAGLARAKPAHRHSGRMRRHLADAEEEARRTGRGIWSDWETGRATE